MLYGHHSPVELYLFCYFIDVEFIKLLYEVSDCTTHDFVISWIHGHDSLSMKTFKIQWFHIYGRIHDLHH